MILDNYFKKSFKKLSNNFLTKLNKGKLNVIFPDGENQLFTGKNYGFEADIKLKNYKLFNKLLRKGAVGFAESYMDGDFDTNNLSKLLLLGHDNENIFLQNIKNNLISSSYIKFKHFLNQNTVKKSKKNIEYHYDLGNDFYKHWLDETMTYSSGIFLKKNHSLLDAQINKYEQIIKPMELSENTNLLEIGCGWGGFSSYVAKKYNSNVRAITISKKQYEYASQHIYNEGLNEKVTIEMIDYRDITEKYLNIASIEMFEAVGKKYWITFLDTIKKSLVPGGVASLQIITINDRKAELYQSNPDFIQQYIFPGGVLPSKNQLEKITNDMGLSFIELKNYKNSYAQTLQIWNDKFQKAWPNIATQGFSLRFKKMWEYYLSYCEVGFLSGATDVSQFIIKK